MREERGREERGRERGREERDDYTTRNAARGGGFSEMLCV